MTPARANQRSVRDTYFHLGTIPFWGVHIAAIVGVALIGFSWTGLGLAAALYFGRMFFVVAAYHRYFAHRSYKTSRAMQLMLAIGGSTTAQKGVLWWAHHHRHHHRASDAADDLHSPVQDGFWWSHLGWILARDYKATNYDTIRDFAKYPELRWVDRSWWVFPTALGAVLFAIGGVHALVWGLFVSTTVLWHGTFTINSLSHVFGSRRYQTRDDSRNQWLLALITMGEGWHNNHHHYQLSCRQGFRWYEIDLGYYIIRLLAAVGLVWDVRVAPAHIVAGRPRAERTPAVAPRT